MMENVALSASTSRQVQTVFREHMILQAFSKISRYQAECRLFEKKYGAPLDNVKQSKQHEGMEDFTLEDDLLDWEYAQTALMWWQAQLREFRNAA
jgi:hypothetical protein